MRGCSLIPHFSRTDEGICPIESWSRMKKLAFSLVLIHGVLRDGDCSPRGIHKRTFVKGMELALLNNWKGAELVKEYQHVLVKNQS